LKVLARKKMLMDLKHECKKWIQKEQIADTIQASRASVFALLGAGDIGEEIQVLKSQIRSNENV
jgi:ribosomal protein S24E